MSQVAYPLQELLAQCRALRRQGAARQALQLLQNALAEPHPGGAEPQPADLGWLHHERADFARDVGDLALAVASAQAAEAQFAAVGDQAGVAASLLLQGDVAWATGQPGQASSFWANARSQADAAGAGVLSARALLALAIRELGADTDVGEAMLQAAEARVAVVPALDELDQWRAAADAVRASLAIVRARLAMAAQRWAEARLLLGAAAEAAGALQDAGLYTQCLRLDALLARKAGDPSAAVTSLQLALVAAEKTGDVAQLWMCRAELALALLDNEAPQQAGLLIPATVPEELRQLPAAAAAVLEAYAALALTSGQPAAAEPALYAALDLRRRCEDGPGQVRALAALADALRLQGASDDARRVADQAVVIAQASGRADLQLAVALAHARLAGSALSVGDAQALATLAGRAGGTADQLAALDFAAAATLDHGDAGQAVAIARQAVAAAAEQPLVRLQARAAARLAQTLSATDAPEEALATAQKASDLAQAAGDWHAQSKALLVAGAVLAATGRADEANLAFSHAQQAATAAHRADLQAEAWLAFAQLQASYGRYGDAATAFDNALRAAAQVADAAAHVRALRGLAWCARAQGQFAAALDFLVRGRELAASADHIAAALACRVDEAHLAAHQAQFAEALAIVGALDLAACPPVSRGEALTLLAQVHAKTGDLERAAAAATKAIACLRGPNEARSLGAALYLGGQIAGLRGDGAAAGALLGEALVVTARAGLPEQHMVRQTIERIRRQAEAIAP